MLFGKRKQVVKRILIVEDEPLTAFDNENILGDAGYEIVATVDDLDEALDVARARRGPPRSSATSACASSRRGSSWRARRRRRASRPCSRPAMPIPGASDIAVGCLLKPYNERQLCKAIECVDRHLQGEKVKAPKGLELFIVAQGQRNSPNRSSRG